MRPLELTLALALFSVAPSVLAGETAPPLPPPSLAPPVAPPPGEPAPIAAPPDVAPEPPLTPEQLQAFAEVVDDTPENVGRRLREDPDLAALALRAGKARVARKHSGKTMTIAGFTIVGVAAVVGAVLALTAYHVDQNGAHIDWGRYGLGLEIDALGLSAG